MASRPRKPMTLASPHSHGQNAFGDSSSALPSVVLTLFRLYHPTTFLRLLHQSGHWQSSQVRSALLFWEYHLNLSVRSLLCSTGFLIGFGRQLKSMVDEKRKKTTIIFLSALFGTLVSALLFDSRLLVFLCLLVQIPSYIWYCASYFPFAQECILSCLKGVKGRFTGG